MKRSEINRIIEHATRFLSQRQFPLPKFAYWRLKDWRTKGPEVQQILDVRLGWDITDYGSGDFDRVGLTHFTIRNGRDVRKGGKKYCEKVLIMAGGQGLPMHFHHNKMEDIINRGGGVLRVQLYGSTEDDRLAETPVSVYTDGEQREVDPGGIIDLDPGESITIAPRMFHSFWKKEEKSYILIGEVSGVNDDVGDNVYLDRVGRFPDIEEDEEPLYLLCSDYEKFLGR